MTDEFMALVERNRALTDELREVRDRMAVLSPIRNTDYRIAIRPDDADAHPMSYDTRLDDIVVKDVAMFRAEQMDTHTWWVCCYLDNDTHDRICWNVSARTRPRRIDWTASEFPVSTVRYEHDQPDAMVNG